MSMITHPAIRAEFPAVRRMLYLDAAFQTPMPVCVRKALEQFLFESHETAGPKSVWLRRAETARAKMANLLGADPAEIAFTKNTSEGLNIAANAVPLNPRDTVLMLAGDHPNHTYAWLNMKRKGVNVRFIELDDASIADASTFLPHIDSSIRVIALSHVSFHAGQVHDIASIGRLCAQHNIYLVVDAMQSIGVLPLDVKFMGISILAAGTHKGLMVPQGSGVLYVKQELQELQPAYLAMSSMAQPPQNYIANAEDLTPRADARRFELGNYNLPGLHALSSALDLIDSLGREAIRQHVCMLGDALIQHLDALQIALVGPRAQGHRAHIYVLRLPIDPWCDYFARHQVRVSPERGGIRISFGAFNNLEDVKKLVDLIRKGLTQDGLPAQ